MPNTDPVGVLIVGAGRMAQHHARAIARARVPGRVVGVMDLDQEARTALVERCPGATGFDQIDVALAHPDADVVHVCTPPHTHEQLAAASLRAGRHVYVEKPFASSPEAAEDILELAESRGLQVCAGHQLLFESPARQALELLPALGTVAHIESYFSFRTVRRGVGGAPMAADDQLLDILPHPTYLLLGFLAAAAPSGTTELGSIELGPGGTVHALVRRGDVTATLVVTLEGRPVESYLRLVGTNGTVNADFVRGTVQRLIGPGTSTIDKLLNPFQLGSQLLTGTFAAIVRRVIQRDRSYPGLAEIFEAFYRAIQTGEPVPTSRDSIVETVRICSSIAKKIQAPVLSSSAQESRTATKNQQKVVVTGGTGFLGATVVSSLLRQGLPVRVLARRVPASWERLEGVEYVRCDLADGIPPEALGDVTAVIHTAAETVGGWDAHQRNSIDATETVLRAAAAAGVKRVVHVSSIGILAAKRGRTIGRDGDLEPDGRRRGPYVWGKLESERLALRLGHELGLELKVVRPGALVDYAQFDPPGRLGKRIGNLFVAVGSARDELGIVDVSFCADVVTWMMLHPEEASDALNVLDPVLPTKRELLQRLRRSNPGIRVVWLPRLVLVPMSWLAIALQKALRPRRPAINVAKVFAPQHYDTSAMRELAPRVSELTGRVEEAGNGPAARAGQPAGPCAA